MMDIDCQLYIPPTKRPANGPLVPGVTKHPKLSETSNPSIILPPLPATLTPPLTKVSKADPRLNKPKEHPQSSGSGALPGSGPTSNTRSSSASRSTTGSAASSISGSSFSEKFMEERRKLEIGKANEGSNPLPKPGNSATSTKKNTSNKSKKK